MSNSIELSGIFSRGYGIIPKALMEADDLNIYAKGVIAYMLSFTGGGKVECFPSVDTIGKALGISKPTTIKAINNLCEKGYIRREKLRPDDKLSHANKYIIQFTAESKPALPTRATSLTSEVSDVYPNNTISNNTSINNTRGRTQFVPPTIEQVKEFMSKLEGYENGDCTDMLDHYISTGWMTTGGAKIKNWEAAARKWIRRKVKYSNSKFNSQNKQPSSPMMHPENDYLSKVF